MGQARPITGDHGEYVTDTKPVLFIVDGAIDATGALISATRQAGLTNDVIDTILVLPIDHRSTGQEGESFAGVIRLPIVALRKSLRGILLYIPALVISAMHLNRQIKRRRCTRLQLNDFSLAQGTFLRLLGYRGRIVTWVRIDPKRYGIIGRIWLGLARWSSDELVVVSKFIGDQLPPDYRSTLIYDAVPPTRDVAKATSQCLLFVGNYIEGKGQDDAIRAFHEISAQFPKAELLFHGSDMGLAKNRDYRSKLGRLGENGAGRGRIHIRDFVKVPGAIYRRGYAAINFSHSESFSLTCLEASAHGLAVLATRSGGPEEIVEDGVTGFLVPVGDIEAMAGRMAELLADPARAAAMGDAGRRLVGQRFSTSQFRSRLLKVLDLN